MVGVQEVIHIKKIIQKLKNKFLLPFYKRNGFFNFFRTSLIPSIIHILVIKIGWAVFEKMRFFDFSKFVHNVCEKIFSELILGVNLSCNRSHLPSQYGSNPSRGTQTMLILLRPLKWTLPERDDPPPPLLYAIINNLYINQGYSLTSYASNSTVKLPNLAYNGTNQSSLRSINVCYRNLYLELALYIITLN